MTVNTPENNTAVPIAQEKVDTNLSQVQVDSNLSQEKSEDGKAEDPNWRAFREARKKDRIDKEAAERRAIEKAAEAEALKAALDAIVSKPGQQQQQGYNDGYAQEESEDERIEKKVQAALAQRENEAERKRLDREHQEYPSRLRQMFPDFDSVMSQEAVDYFEYHYGEVAKPLSRLPDGFDKWADIYRNVKKFVPNATIAKKEAARAEANMNKPKSMSSSNVTQPGEAIGSAQLSEEKRAANWARMQKMLKSVG